jgi:transglutaminase-like putative cysteine protease
MISLKIRATLDYLVDGQSELLFHVLPARTSQQSVDGERLRLSGCAAPTEHVDPVTGNRMLKASSPGGALRLEYESVVTLDHHFAAAVAVPELQVRDIPVEVLPYLLPSRYCESDRLSAFAMHTFGHLAPGHQRVQAVCDWVFRNVRFSPGASNSATSAQGTLDSRAGVCRDFAHLAIALLRALNIPARIVSSYDYGADPALGPPDFHAYVEAFLGRRWFVFDPTRMCPRKGLVRIGSGFDAADVAFSTLYGPARFASMKLDVVAHDEAGELLAVQDDPALAVSTSGMRDLFRHACPAATNLPRAGVSAAPATRRAVAAGGMTGGFAAVRHSDSRVN